MPGKIPPSTWGPFFWHTIHLTALGYPTKPTYAEKRAAKEFYESFVHLIPCPICKLHYAENLKELPIGPSLDTRDDLFRWTVTMHNHVNKQLGKPEYSELDAVKFYEALGDLGRSPIWTPQDLHAQQFAEMAKVGFIGIIGLGFVGGFTFWWFGQK